MKIHYSLILTVTTTILMCTGLRAGDPYLMPGEDGYLENVQMLTSGGENAEAYFNQDATMICWQGQWGNVPADQIWVMPVKGGKRKMVSTGLGKTTCSFFIPNSRRLVFCSTHEHSAAPPIPPDPGAGYVWMLDEYDVYTVNQDGTGIMRLTPDPGYDAESAVSPDGTRIVFTSVRSGDPEIYTMNLDGTDLKQLTFTHGYDGGPFYSPLGDWIVFRSHLPESDEELKRYNELMAKNMVEPMRFEIQIMRPDGSDRRQITDLGVASFAPYMHPDGQRIIFCSNYSKVKGKSPKGMPVFNLFVINIDGSELKQITFNDSFDGFPMFSNDGSKLIWSSNRHAPEPRSTNIFVADWKN